jgi:hypothetical protein
VIVDLPDRAVGIADLVVSALGPKAAVPRLRAKWLRRWTAAIPDQGSH